MVILGRFKFIWVDSHESTTTRLAISIGATLLPAVRTYRRLLYLFVRFGRNFRDNSATICVRLLFLHSSSLFCGK